MGWVEDTRGTPVSGAVISLFGKGLEGGGLVTFSDSAGRFFLPSLPAGSYTLRALGGRLRAPARQVTVLPNQESVFSVSLSAPDGAAEEEVAAALKETSAEREWRWLLRHKPRSVLEAREHEPTRSDREDEAPAAADLGERLTPWMNGTVEVVTNPGAFGDEPADNGRPSGLGVVRLRGRFAERGRWSLGGILTESENTTWRMAAEFVVEPGGGHEIQAGTGYGSRLLRPLASALTDGRGDDRSMGAMFAQDRWNAGNGLTATVGARYSYIGFLADPNHLDPVGSVELATDRYTRIRGTISTRTLTPGGDLLTLSTLASAPAIAYALMGGDLRPERIVRYEVAIDRTVGPTRMGALVFQEGARDQLVNVFERPGPSRTLRISNGPTMRARGLGLNFGHRFGDLVSGSVTYTYGRTASDTIGATRVFPAFRDNDFHDVVARVETFVDWSDTRLSAFYRVNTLSPRAEGPGTQGVTNTRFDVQLTQGLPFLGALTRADWELLLAYRNLFYETSEGGSLDELAVVNPPSRMVGGISVRF